MQPHEVILERRHDLLQVSRIDDRFVRVAGVINVLLSVTVNSRRKIFVGDTAFTHGLILLAAALRDLAIAEYSPREIKSAVLLGELGSKIRDQAIADGMNTLLVSGMKKVKEGVTTLDEVQSVVFMKDGEVVTENAQRCPRTMEALALAPQPLVPGQTPSALFSRLAPGAMKAPAVP